MVTDTTQYLPREVVDRHGLSLVSLYVNWDGRTDRECDMPDYDAVLRPPAGERGDLPSTSQPSVGDFLAVYEPLIEAAPTSCRSTSRAASRAPCAPPSRRATRSSSAASTPARIVVMDSRTGCAGHGLMAIAAANAAAAAPTRRRAAAAAAALRERMPILFAVDTLEYLRRGGRIGAAQALLGSALKIKPILSIEGEIMPVERVRTPGRAIDRLVRELQEQRDAGADLFFIQHVQAPEVAERLAERGREIYGRDPEFVSEIGPVIGTHAGPGLVGVTALPSPARPCCGTRLAAGLRAARCEPPGGERLPPAAADRRRRDPDARRSCAIVLTVIACVARAVPDLPAAQAADLDLHRRLPRHRARRAGPLPPALDAARLRRRDRLSRADPRADPDHGRARPADRHAGQQPRGVAARLRARPLGLRPEEPPLRKLEQDYDITGKLEEQAAKLPAKLGDAAGVLCDIGVGIVNSLFAAITIICSACS